MQGFSSTFFTTWKMSMDSQQTESTLQQAFPSSLPSASHSAPTPLLSPLSTFFYMVSSPFFLLYLYSFSFPFSYFSELAQSSPWVGASFPSLVLCLGWQSLGYVEKSLCSFPELWAAWDFLEMPLNLVGPLSFAQMFEVLLAGSAVVIECYWNIPWKTHHSLETGLFF